MSKYYVQSGENRVIISSESDMSTEEAAYIAVSQFVRGDIKMSQATVVSERGFIDDGIHRGDDVFYTQDILKSIGF